jgi:tungstate transport system ATP-binding protein
MYKLQAENLSKEYRGKRVLDIDLLQIREGTITAVIGPSGSGKSTLLRILNLLEKPSRGKIIYDGKETGKFKRWDLQRRMVLVEQKPLMFNASVRDNVSYGLKVRGLGKKEIRKKVSDALHRVSLENFAKKNALSLSGGEAQRIALARAMVVNPEVLLLDEPTANLDPYNVSMMEDLIRYINGLGVTIVIVTHNMFQAKRISHDLAFLSEGKLIEFGTTGDVFAKPRDHRTAAFIAGEMVY